MALSYTGSEIQAIDEEVIIIIILIISSSAIFCQWDFSGPVHDFNEEFCLRAEDM